MAVLPAGTAVAATASPVAPGAAGLTQNSVITAIGPDGTMAGTEGSASVIWTAAGRTVRLPAGSEVRTITASGLVGGSSGGTATIWRTNGSTVATRVGARVVDLTEGGTAAIVSGPDATNDSGLWSGGAVTPLRVLGRPDARVQPADINNNGEVVGLATVPGSWQWTPVRCQANGDCVQLPLPSPGADVHVAAINDSGRVLGSNDGKGLLWDSAGPPTPLPPAAGSTYARPADGRQALNARGDVIGYSGPGYDLEHPVLWPAGGAPVALPRSTTHTTSELRAINDNGDIAAIGSDGTSRAERVLFWRGGQLSQFSLLPLRTGGTVVGLSETGRVAGGSRLRIGSIPGFTYYSERATYWDPR
ncbi:hypothetical protein [Actinokineospora pegani]|uniref:hypothetical protein n=1 Tax=Actinokineospora pegani TaxID=2654637 RepID=UPI0012E9C054|nr:hypothetical protein [Actinokineospora pegani]